MSDEWFCQIFGNVLGPLSWGELSAMARDQSLMGDDNVRQGRDGEWTKANSVEGLFPRAKTAPTQSPAASGDQTAVAVDSMCLAQLEDAPITPPRWAQMPDVETLLEVDVAEITAAKITNADADLMPRPAEIPARHPLPTAIREPIFSRLRDVVRSLSRRNQMLSVAVVVLVVGVGWFLNHQRRVTYQAAYLEVQRLHRHWQQAQPEPLDPVSAQAFQQKLHEQRRRVIEQIAGSRASSAGGAVRDAATVLGELIELSNASEKSTDRSQRTALEMHFHDSMRQARQGLFAE